MDAIVTPDVDEDLTRILIYEHRDLLALMLGCRKAYLNFIRARESLAKTENQNLTTCRPLQGTGHQSRR